MERRFLGFFDPSVVELRDVDMTILFEEEGSFVNVPVNGISGGWGDGERDTRVILNVEWRMGEDVEKTELPSAVSAGKGGKIGRDIYDQTSRGERRILKNRMDNTDL